MKKYYSGVLYVLIIFLNVVVLTCLSLSDQARSKGFVYLSEVDHTIRSSVRYYSKENFVGSPVDGYTKPVIIMTRQAAEALHKVQEEIAKDGYCLVVYDAYRPQQAVDHFVRWSAEVKNQTKKAYYYPRVNKAHVFDLGYVARRSGHSRGSTVDLTIMRSDKVVHALVAKKRALQDGFKIFFLDDGTVDMGSSFDLFDEASHTASDLVEPKQKALREYFKSVMEKHGFKNYHEEWWHYTLVNEPFAASDDASYFNFPVD